VDPDYRTPDKRWGDLITISGRLALASDDTQTIAEILHLEQQEYCKRFLRTPVASEEIHSAPNKAVPALLDHLSTPNTTLRKQIIQTFDDFPDGYGGWDEKIKEAVLTQLEDDDWQVQAAAAGVLNRWRETVEERDRTEHDEWVETITDTLVELLDDDKWRVRRPGAA
jgi:HEAT repeat protein